MLIPSRHVSVLVHISGVRKEPKILFLTDPWDLIHGGQLTLENSSKYRAKLTTQPQQMTTTVAARSGGFDAVQVRQHRSVKNSDSRSSGDKDEDNGKGKDAAVKL